MNKKQVAIIVTLLVLIVCAGVLAAQLNNPLAVNENDVSNGTSTLSLNKNTNKAAAVDYFTESKLTREQQDNTTLENLKSIKDDKDMAADNRNSAASEYQRLSIEKLNIVNVEAQVKALGFEDAICFINNGKVKVVVKTSDKLNDKSVKDISAIIMDVFKTKDVSIEGTK